MPCVQCSPHASALVAVAIRVQCDYSTCKRRQWTAPLSEDRPVPHPLPENNRWTKSLTSDVYHGPNCYTIALGLLGVNGYLSSYTCRCACVYDDRTNWSWTKDSGEVDYLYLGQALRSRLYARFAVTRFAGGNDIVPFHTSEFETVNK